MTTSYKTMSFNLDRLAIAGLLMTAVLPFAAVSPAEAATIDCTARAEMVRDVATTAEPATAGKALRTVQLAEKICAEGNRREAGKKFDLAMRQLETAVQLADRR